MVVDEKSRGSTVERFVKKEVTEQEKDDETFSSQRDLNPLQKSPHFMPVLLQEHNVALDYPFPPKSYKPMPDFLPDSKKPRESDSRTKHGISSHAKKILSSNVAANHGISFLCEPKPSVLTRAEEVRANLDPQFPCFIKYLTRSHVSGGFWLGIPGLFCKRHLPDKDRTVILEDESGREYKVKYIMHKTGLSGGWRQFSLVHRLLEGDALVFVLIEPTKFKVHTIRSSDMNEVDRGLSLLNLAPSRQIKKNASMDTEECIHLNRKLLNPQSVTLVHKKKRTLGLGLASKSRQQVKQSNVASTAPGDSKSTILTAQFKDVESLEDFCIQIDGKLIDSELSADVRSKYYKLCFSQKAFLHDSLIRGMNLYLTVGIISEIVHISDAIESSNITTPRLEFSKWDKTLLGFEHLGMNVEFLRVQLRRLVSIAYESKGAAETRCYLVAQPKLCQAEDEMRNIEVKLVELKNACNEFGAYIEGLKSKAEIYQLKYQDEVAAPW